MKIKKNGFMEGAIIATIAIIITKILGILYVIPFYKIIGTQGGALYSYAYNIYNIFLIISSAGIPLAISKLTSEYETLKEYDKKNEMYKISKKLIYIFSISAFLLCFIFAKPIAKIILGNLQGGNTIEDVCFVIRCISFALLIVPVLSIYRGYLQGHKYITVSSLSQVIEQIVRILIILIGSFICVKILNIDIKYAIGISVFSAAIGALISYVYLHIKTKKANIIKDTTKKEFSKEEKKEILKKIIGYCIPFIVINIANSLYDTTDMILIIRGLSKLGFNAQDVETISSIFTTWGNKLVTVVKSFATGLTISLIPSLVNAYISKDMKRANYYYNKSLKVLLFIILPLTIFMSLFSKEIWTLFYGKSYYGPIIFSFQILVGVLDSAYLISCSTLQGLYKTKLVYFSSIIGLIVNALLDLPLMFLFNIIGIYPFYGAIVATIIGYIIALGIPMYILYNKEGFRYSETLKTLPNCLLSILIIIIVSTLYKKIMPTFTSFVGICIYILIIALILSIIYYMMNKKILIKLIKEKKGN